MSKKQNHDKNLHPSNPAHANFFEYASHIPEVARGLLQKHLPKELLDQIDLNRISTEKTSFISKALKKNIADCLIKAYIQNEEAYIIELVEHQSTNDPIMPFRVLEYMVLIWRNYLKQNKNSTKLPLIYPIVISNSTENNKMPTALDELFDYNKTAKSIIDFKYKLIDLIKTPEEQFNHEIWSDFLELGLKYNRELSLNEAINKMKEKIEFFSKTPEGIDYISSFLCYNIYDIEEQDLEEAGRSLKQILGQTGDNIMGSAARKLIDEGIQLGESRGKYEARIQTAKNMLFENIPIITISKCTGLSIAEINKIKQEIEK